jgi:hypothetical protein
VTGQLDVAWDDRSPAREALGDEERFAILRRLLHDPAIELRDRFAGAVMLLYGKPLTHIAALPTAAVNIDRGGQVTLRLGRGDVTLPDPLDGIALAFDPNSSTALALRVGCYLGVTPGRTSPQTRSGSD